MHTNIQTCRWQRHRSHSKQLRPSGGRRSRAKPNNVRRAHGPLDACQSQQSTGQRTGGHTAGGRRASRVWDHRTPICCQRRLLSPSGHTPGNWKRFAEGHTSWEEEGEKRRGCNESRKHTPSSSSTKNWIGPAETGRNRMRSVETGISWIVFDLCREIIIIVRAAHNYRCVLLPRILRRHLLGRRSLFMCGSSIRGQPWSVCSPVGWSVVGA